MTSVRLLFYVTLMLLVAFTFSFARDLGWLAALPWVASAWILWGIGVAWARAKGG